MQEIKLRTGIITEKTLINRYGSDSQKSCFQKKGYLVGSYKTSFSNMLSRYCEFEKHGKGKYKIKRVYKYPLPVNFTKMNKPMYRYIVPLLLDVALEYAEKYERFSNTPMNLAQSIGLIGKKNYFGKNLEVKFAFTTRDKIHTYFEFYNKVTTLVRHYLVTALDYLQEYGCITYKESYRMKENIIAEDQRHEHSVVVSKKIRPMTLEEINKYNSLLNKIDRYLGINNSKERYYSSKSKEFSRLLSEELQKNNIEYIFKACEITPADIDKCKYLISLFGEYDRQIFTTKLKNEFTTTLLANAEKRYDTNPEKYAYTGGKENYLETYRELCKLTIG